MLNAKELKAALSEEIRIIRHIATKLDPNKMGLSSNRRAALND